MYSSGPLSLQTIFSGTGNAVEFLFYWTIAQMFFVALGVLSIIGINFLNGGFYRYENSIAYYELIWTSFPTLILCSVAGPSIYLLYIHEQECEESLNINATGHQWYWNYEYSDLEETSLDSLMSPLEDLSPGETRFLETDNRPVFPVNTSIRILISSEDVIHSLALPTLGVNIDATPGRLNSVNILFPSVGIFYGQCSELCGANHSLMPITIEVTSPLLFIEWFKSA